MRKTALTLTISTLVVGIFGAFLHWLQLMNAFDAESGFPVPGAMTTLLFIAYSVLAVAAMAALSLRLRRLGRDKDAVNALRAGSPVPVAAAWVLGVGFVLCACIVMFTANQSRYPLIQRLMGAAGILAGLCFPFLHGRNDSVEPGAMSRVAAIVVPLFYCYWLVFCYKTNAEDPVISHFALEILAIAAAAMAFYYAAGYFFSQGKPGRTLFTLTLSSYMNIAVIFKQRSMAMTGLLALSAGMLLLLQYLLISNMREYYDDDEE